MSQRNLSGQQFRQLTMFEPAHRLMDGGVGSFNPGDLPDSWYDDTNGDEQYAQGNADEGWDMKLEEAHQSGLVESVEKRGVSKPVTLSAVAHAPRHPMWTPIPVGNIMDGHHRIAAANEVDPHMEVPVKWRDERKFGPTKNPWDFV